MPIGKTVTLVVLAIAIFFLAISLLKDALRLIYDIIIAPIIGLVVMVGGVIAGMKDRRKEKKAENDEE